MWCSICSGCQGWGPHAALAPATGTEGLQLRQLEPAKKKIHGALGANVAQVWVGHCGSAGYWLLQGGAPPSCHAWKGSPVPEKNLLVRVHSLHQAVPDWGWDNAGNIELLPTPPVWLFLDFLLH